MEEKTWTQYEYVIHQPGTMWKRFIYYFTAKGYMDNIFHSGFSPKKWNAGDILQEKIKKIGWIREVSFLGNYFFMMARKLFVYVVRE